MRSMNSRCAGGWKRCFIFAAMRYSLMEMDSSFGSSMRRGGVAWSARAKGRAQSRRSMWRLRSRRWRRPRLPVATARSAVAGEGASAVAPEASPWASPRHVLRRRVARPCREC